MTDEYEEESQFPESQFSESQPTPQLPQMANYDIDSLNYLRDITEDHYYERILTFIDYSSFTSKTKDALRLLIFTYSEPIDFSLTNIKTDIELKRFYNNFRMARKKFKCGIQQRDDTNLLSQLLDHIESHLQLRLSRAKGGFERMEQSSIRQHSSQTADYTQTQQTGNNRTDSISQIFKSKNQG